MSNAAKAERNAAAAEELNAQAIVGGPERFVERPGRSWETCVGRGFVAFRKQCTGRGDCHSEGNGHGRVHAISAQMGGGLASSIPDRFKDP